MVKNALGKSNFTYQKRMNGLASNLAQKMACLHNSGSTLRIFFLISHSERCQVVCENYVNGFLNSGPKMVLPHNFKSAWRSKVFFFHSKKGQYVHKNGFNSFSEKNSYLGQMTKSDPQMTCHHSLGFTLMIFKVLHSERG